MNFCSRFLVSCHAADLTRETFTAWGESMASLHPTTRRARLRTVYHFCLFRRREDPHGFVPDPTQFPPQGPRPLPYIFSEAEIIRLLAAAEGLAPHKASPLHREVAASASSSCTRRASVVANWCASPSATTRRLIKSCTCVGRNSTNHASCPCR